MPRIENTPKGSPEEEESSSSPTGRTPGGREVTPGGEPLSPAESFFSSSESFFSFGEPSVSSSDFFGFGETRVSSAGFFGSGEPDSYYERLDARKIFGFGTSPEYIPEDAEGSAAETLEFTPDEFFEALRSPTPIKAKEIVVDGDLDLIDSSLQRLPPHLTIKGSLTIQGTQYRYLNELPPHLTVEKNLVLNGCASFNSLSHHLKVGGDADLSHTDVDVLPQDMTVGGDLILQGCTRLTSLPEERMELGGNLDLRVTMLKSVPSWITTLGPRSDGSVRVVDLSLTALREADIDRLKETVAPGMRFFFT